MRWRWRKAPPWSGWELLFSGKGIDHWKEEGITFDAIYTGYLGTEEEIDTVIGIIQKFRNENTLVFVDPAMGDNGKLYPAFNEHYARKNADLCAVADITDPNLTEAAFVRYHPEDQENMKNRCSAEVLRPESIYRIRISAQARLSLSAL